MTSMLNAFANRIAYGNTGQPKGKQFTLKPFQGVLVHPDGWTIPQSYLDGSYADLIAYLQAAQLNDPATRLWCFPAFYGVTETTDAAETQKSPNGNQVGYTENPQSMDVELENLGVEYYKNIRQFMDRTDLRGIFFQEDGILLEKTDGGVQGCELSLIPKQATIATKEAYAKHIVAMQIKDEKFLSDNVHFVQTQSGKKFINNFKGIVDVEISEPSNLVVKAVTVIGDIDLYDTYSGDLDVVGAWDITVKSTGEVIAPTSVTKNDTYKGWTIVHAGVGPCTISLKNPTALVALGVGSATSGGFESQPFLLGE